VPSPGLRRSRREGDGHLTVIDFGRSPVALQGAPDSQDGGVDVVVQVVVDDGVVNIKRFGFAPELLPQRLDVLLCPIKIAEPVLLTVSPEALLELTTPKLEIRMLLGLESDPVWVRPDDIIGEQHLVVLLIADELERQLSVLINVHPERRNHVLEQRPVKHQRLLRPASTTQSKDAIEGGERAIEQRQQKLSPLIASSITRPRTMRPDVGQEAIAQFQLRRVPTFEPDGIRVRW
jgi:hypothetical protein